MNNIVLVVKFNLFRKIMFINVSTVIFIVSNMTFIVSKVMNFIITNVIYIVIFIKMYHFNQIFGNKSRICSHVTFDSHKNELHLPYS